MLRVTCDLPHHSISLKPEWNHLRDLQMADQHFGKPGRISILLGVDIFVAALLPGRRVGSPGAPVAIETVFGWVLAGRTDSLHPNTHITTHHASLLSSDDLLRQFWETEEIADPQMSYTVEERLVVQHFQETHFRSESRHFTVPLPHKSDATALGESRSQAVRRFQSLNHTLHLKSQFSEFSTVIQEYFDMEHAELVPVTDLEKPPQQVFYLPMHAVRKDSSTTMKVRAIFDASAKSSSTPLLLYWYILYWYISQ